MVKLFTREVWWTKFLCKQARVCSNGVTRLKSERFDIKVKAVDDFVEIRQPNFPCINARMSQKCNESTYRHGGEVEKQWNS